MMKKVQRSKRLPLSATDKLRLSAQLSREAKVLRLRVQRRDLQGECREDLLRAASLAGQTSRLLRKEALEKLQ